MAICEKCGGKYTPTRTNPGCPRCEQEASEAPAPARAAAPAAARPVRKSAPGAAAAPAGRAAPAPPPRPRRVAARPVEPEPEEEEAREIHHKEDEGVLDQSSKIGLIAAGGLAVIVLGAVVIVTNKHATERAAEEAYQNEVKDLYTKLSSMNLDDEAQAKSLLQLAKDTERRWKDHELAPKIQTLVARAGVSLDTGKERRQTLGRFTEIEGLLKDTSALSPETLNDLRRNLTELEAKMTLGGDEYVKRHAAARLTADKAYVTRLLDSAKEAGSPRAALTQSQTAEDEIRKVLDQAIMDKNQEMQTFYSDLYKKAIGQTDQLAGALFTDKVISELPWTDCLNGDQLKNWNASSAKGFSHDTQAGQLVLIGPDPDAGRQAVISIGDREQWRNFVFDTEFTVEKGSAELFLRLGKAPNANTVSYPIATEGDSANLKAGKKYHLTMKLVGSTLSTRYDNEDIDTPPPKDEQLSWAKTRKGAIGFLIPSGLRMRFTSFKVRELR
jgi:hypothetical protein